MIWVLIICLGATNALVCDAKPKWYMSQSECETDRKKEVDATTTKCMIFI